MTEQAYELLAKALDELPNGFPRTPAGTELLILEKILSPEQAALAARLTGTMEPLADIAARLGQPALEVRTRLMELVRRGAAWFDKEGGKPRFRLAPFVVGLYEEQRDRMDHELAHLVEHYMLDGGARGIMGPEPALHRVVPTQGTVKSERILPYEDVRAMLLEAKSFWVRDCICRKQQAHMDRPCRFPIHVCLSFSSSGRPGDINQQEALAILEQTEREGLVHTVSNVQAGHSYICNCCSCCCAIMRGITDYGLANSVAAANYRAAIAPDACQGCETCVERCQVHAITMQNGTAIVDLARCIGCGLCVSGCPDGAARLERKPEAEIVEPPDNYATWERQRLESRRTP